MPISYFSLCKGSTLIFIHFPPYVLVGLGGAIGSVLRWMISIRLDDSLGSLPLGREGFAWPTLIVNIMGCLAIGFIAGLIWFCEVN